MKYVQKFNIYVCGGGREREREGETERLVLESLVSFFPFLTKHKTLKEL